MAFQPGEENRRKENIGIILMHERRNSMAQGTKNKLIDPVCGKEVSPDSKYRSYYVNGYHYFCSAKDKEEFDKQPEVYSGEETSMVRKGCDS